MFDGLYSFIGVVLSYASLKVCKIIKEKDNRDFYFGKYILEPVVIAINSFILIITCFYSMVDSIKTLLNGGNSVNIGAAFSYSIVSTIGCGLIFYKINQKNRKEQSELIKSESIQWFMDFLVSGSILIGFAIIFILSKTSYKDIVRYIDPLMLLIASMICLKSPIKRFIHNFKEVIGIIKPEKITKQVEKHIKNIKKKYGYNNVNTKVIKRGRSVQIEINFEEEESSKDEVTLEEMELIKNELLKKIDTGKYYKDLKLTFEIGKNMYIEITS